MKIFLVISLLVGAQVAKAQEASISPEIIEIRKSLPMEPTEKAVKDFILNRGSSAGLKAGAYVNVVREVAVNDPVRNKALGTLHVPVGKIQIIHVESNISVARLQSELGNEDRPTVEYEALMIGDQVDLSSISMEAPKASKKKWTTAAVDESASKAEQLETADRAEAEHQTVQLQTATVPTTSQQPSAIKPTAKNESETKKPDNKSVAQNTNNEQPAFIITPIEPETEVPTKKATVTAATTAN